MIDQQYKADKEKLHKIRLLLVSNLVSAPTVERLISRFMDERKIIVSSFYSIFIINLTYGHYWFQEMIVKSYNYVWRD